MEIISELMLSMNELSKPWFGKENQRIECYIESPKANLILVQTSPYPLLLCLSNTSTRSWEEKIWTIFISEERLIIHIVVMGHNMCKLKMVYIL
jgi:hypothetical protein